MKFIVSQISYFVKIRDFRRNISGLIKYILFLIALILIYTVAFHYLMLYAEGREYSWISGLYWTLVVMTTLGFGDITFQSDIGRAFSVIVLISGVVLLLIMLPFTFIRAFYAPWLEAQLHAKCPREVPPGTEDHVIICEYETIAQDLIKKLRQRGIQYFVVEEDAARAVELYHDDISVIHGNVESVSTFRRLNASRARLIFANSDDAANTNIILTVRECAPDVPIVAIAEIDDSIDILELSGATSVLPLKRLLGEKLANRIGVGHGGGVNPIGSLNGFKVFEFNVDDSPFASKKLSDCQIRANCGVNIIGVWERGTLHQAKPESVLTADSVAVGIGTHEQVAQLDQLLRTKALNEPEGVLIIGGGKVGRAAAAAAKAKNLPVFVIEQNKELADVIGDLPDRLTIGNAADRRTLEASGLNEASLAIISTNQDAVNIYLTVYCRRLRPELKIVSRITHERNLEAIHRAGADLALSYAPIGAEHVLALAEGREPVILGENIETFRVATPSSLVGKTLAASQIGAETGLIVLAIEVRGETELVTDAGAVMPADSHLVLLGNLEQFSNFQERFD